MEIGGNPYDPPAGAPFHIAEKGREQMIDGCDFLTEIFETAFRGKVGDRFRVPIRAGTDNANVHLSECFYHVGDELFAIGAVKYVGAKSDGFAARSADMRDDLFRFLPMSEIVYGDFYAASCEGKRNAAPHSATGCARDEGDVLCVQHSSLLSRAGADLRL